MAKEEIFGNKATEEVLNAADYHIINGGKRHELGYGSKIVILFVSGSGSGDQSYYCEFRSTYKAYWHKGTKLTYCGEISEISGSAGNSFIGKIDGREIKCDFLCADEVFTKIEKK